MIVPSTIATTVFVLTVAAVAIALLAATRVAFGPGGVRWARLLTAFVLLITIVVPGQLARASLLDRYSPLPAPALLVVAVMTILTIALARSSFGARLAAAAPLAWLVGFQVFRVPVEWTLHRLYLDGVVPVQMTYAGRNFDIITGVTAAALGLFLASARGRRREDSESSNAGAAARGGGAPRALRLKTALVLLWNLLGLGLLVNIVTIAVLSTPVPFRSFTNGPPNLLPSTFPFIWLPTFLVQAALFGHLVVFRALARRPRP